MSRVMVCARNDNGRLDIRDAILLEDIDATGVLASVGIAMPLTSIYAGLGSAESTV
jgi:hypothetical protein